MDKLAKLALLMLLLSANTILAETKAEKILRYPVGCVPAGYRFDYFTLILQPSAKTYAQTAFFIHNVSNQDIDLFQTRSGDEPYIIHINTTIHANRWSVLAADEKIIKYICAKNLKNNDNAEIIDCSKVLDICQFEQTRFGDNHRGNYWAVENLSTHQETVRAMRYHGVLLIDPKQKDDDETATKG